jgi:Flp pilus assembly protein TadD
MDKQEASRYFELGLECRRQGNNREAIANFEQVVRLDPENYPAWNNAANAHDDLGNHGAAIESWRMAVKVNPDYAIAWHNLGRALLKRSKFENQSELMEAADCLRAAVRAKPDKHESWALLGTALNALGDVDEAEECLTTALRFDPNNVESQNFLAIIRKKKNMPRSAAGLLQKGKVYSISLTDGSAGLYKVLDIDGQAVEVLPINAAEPTRFAGGSKTILAAAVVSFSDPGLPWSSYGEGGSRETQLGTDKGGCFIATAVYGSDQAPQVQTLRVFRDRRLLPSRLGRRVVDWYYRFAPRVAVVVAASPTLIRYLRICLDVLVKRLNRR